MARKNPDNTTVQHVGGGNTGEPVTVTTRGLERWHVAKETGGLVGIVANHSEPTTPDELPALFFRTSGTKQQLCVKFTSGVVQIIATEP